MKRDEAILPILETGKYIHTKTGHFYDVLGVALHTETNEAMVVYRPLWQAKYELFVRPYNMFVESIEVDGEKRQRFEKINA